ncbi:MAG: nuclear transport factor 2 family protein, partial [Firmicutes bacterium]|nr:nuclear transport factor 2 family protein [Bacillota bacterium]
MDERGYIRELYREYWRCMIAKDAEGLRELMADDYALRHMTGARQSREEFLRGLENGVFNYYSAEHDSIEVTVSGDSAV